MSVKLSVKNKTMNEISFIINTAPTAQARPRHAVRGGFSVTYKSEQQKNNEQTLEALIAPYAPKEPFKNAVSINFVAYIPFPQSFSKKKKELAKANKIFPTKKPDIDNLCKQLLDTLTRLNFWLDNKQVIKITAIKIYGEYGKWDVIITGYNDKLNENN